MSNNINHFNIRVYGLLIYENQILVSDELIKNTAITKFPGGGLEFGEGIRQCLQREFLEECDIAIDVQSHFYTNDFFQLSAYNHQHQVISMYYKVSSTELINLQTTDIPHNYRKNSHPPLCLRWVPINSIEPNMFSLPIDKIVAEKLSNL